MKNSIQTSFLVLTIIFYLACIFNSASAAGLKNNELLSRKRRGAAEDLNNYLRGVLENFKSQMSQGIPSLKIPKLEPLKIKNQFIRKQDSKVDLDLKMTNLQVKGLSKFKINNLKLDLTNLRFTFALTIPEILATGHYDLDAKLFKILPLYGKGPFNIKVKQLTISTSVAVTILPNGKGSLAEPPHLNVGFKSANVYFHNLLDSLGPVLNNIINALSKPIFDKMKPKIMDSLKKSLFKILNKQLSKVDITKFLG